MISNWVQDSPLGPLGVTATAAGVRSIDLHPPGATRARRAANSVWRALDAYFAGDVAALDDLPVDLDGRTPFSVAVLGALRRVGAGSLTTYGALAAAVGRPSAARAVGRAVGANPVPVVVACHRVVAGDGSLGGYSGGLDVKRWLLAHEGHAAMTA